MFLLQPLFDAIRLNDINKLRAVLADCRQDHFNINTIEPSTGYPALYMAVGFGNIDVVKEILGYPGCDLDIETEDGFTVLHLAVKDGNEELVALLLKHGANPRKTRDGVTPYDIVKSERKSLLHLFPLDCARFKGKLTSQTWMSIRIRAMSLPMDEGFCFGTANMAVMAMTQKERDSNNQLIGIQQFNNRIKRMRRVSLEHFREKMDNAKNKRLQCIRWVKQLLAVMSDNEITEAYEIFNIDECVPLSEQRKALFEAMLESLILLYLTDEERIDIDIPIFLQNVSLFQAPDKHKKIFTKSTLPIRQSAQRVLPYVIAVALEAQGGIENVDGFSCVANWQTLLSLLSRLESYLQASLSAPIAMLLSNHHHAISISYDPIERVWFFSDINKMKHLTGIYKTDVASLSKKIFSSFTKNDNCVFSADIFINKQHATEAVTAMTGWKKDPLVEQILTPTPEKCHITDSYRTHWINVAEEIGDTESVKRIIAQESFLKRHWKPIVFCSVMALVPISMMVLFSGMGAPIGFMIALAVSALIISAFGPFLGSLKDSIHIEGAKIQAENKKLQPLPNNPLPNKGFKVDLAKAQRFKLFSSLVQNRSNPILPELPPAVRVTQ